MYPLPPRRGKGWFEQTPTWQPEYINKEKGLKFDPDDVFTLADFDL